MKQVITHIAPSPTTLTPPINTQEEGSERKEKHLVFVICIRLHVLKASSCVSQTEPCFLTNHFHYAHCLYILLASLSEPHSMLGLREFVCLSKCLLWTSVYSSVMMHTRNSTIIVMSHACLYLCTFVLSDII